MTVLHTVASLCPSTGGPARSVPGLAAALAAAGAKVELLAAEIPAEYRPPAGVAVHPRQAMADRIDPRHCQLVHDHGVWLPMNHAVARASSGASVPRVVSPRGMLEPWALNYRKWKKRAAWWIYQRSDLRSAAALHATSEAEAEQFRRLGLCQPVFILPNGVDLPQPLPDFGDPPDRRTALFLGRLHPKKGLPLLLDAWAALRPAGWDLQIVGPDEAGHLAELRQQVEKLGLSEVVRFSGSLEGKAKSQAFQAAELFVLPTYSENFGIAVAEALAHGMPVLTTHGAPWELLEQESCGWWVPVDLPSLSAALEDATTRDPGNLREMGARGRQVVADRFGWNRIATDMLACYQWLLDGGPRPDCVR